MANVKLLGMNASTGYHQEASPTADTLMIGAAQFANGADAGGAKFTSLATCTNPTDAANKAYVDAVAAGLSPKNSVVALATTNIASLSGTVTIDGIAVTAGQPVLLTAQTSGNGAKDNGFWIVQSGAWTRPSWFPTGGSAAGSYTYIEEGNTYAKQQWACTTIPGSDVIDTNGTTWSQTASSFNYSAGNGITISNGSIAVNTNASNGLTFNGTLLQVAINSTGGVQNTSTGLSLLLNGATLTTSASGVSVAGLPLAFAVNGVNTANSVTAAALNTLTNATGTVQSADALHTHASAAGAANQQASYANGSTALAIGDPVCWSSTADTLARGQASADATSFVIGVAGAAIAASATGVIVSSGVVKNAFTGFTAGGQVWMGASGGLTQTKPTAVLTRIIRVGIAKNPTDLWVQILDEGKTGAA